MTENNHLGNLVRDARIKAGLSQFDLAIKTGVNPTIISQVENGRRTPSLRTATAISQALGISLDEMTKRAARDCGGAGGIEEMLKSDQAQEP